MPSFSFMIGREQKMSRGLRHGAWGLKQQVIYKHPHVTLEGLSACLRMSQGWCPAGAASW